MKTILILLGAVIGLIGFVVVFGYLLPIRHSAYRSVKFKAPVDRVWAVISDFKEATTWRNDVQSVEPVQSRPGVLAWREIAKNGEG